MTRWPSCLLLLLSLAMILLRRGVASVRDSENRTILSVGYLTAITGELKDKQGLAISGALTMALDEINNDTNLLPNILLDLRWNDTKGDTVLATKAITEMICDGIAVIFGPEGHCYVEAIVTQSRNIPMISYKCSENRASPIQTFARTEPPDTQVIKSVISLLRYYGWKKFSILHDEVWATVADLLKREAIKFNMTINHKESFIDNMAKCCELMLPCCRNGYWYQVVQNTMNRTRIYVFLGTSNALVEFMASMDTANLFSRGEYMVIFVDMMTYTPKEAEKYLRKPDQVEHMTACDETDRFIQRARSLLVVASTPPIETYENFTAKVREYNSRQPFNFVLPSLFHSNNFIKFVSIYAAYLYDSVRLYAWALDKLLREKDHELSDEEVYDVASNGVKIIETIINNRTYKSVTGATINIDSNGDSEGNFSVLAYKPYKYSYRDNLSCNFHMVPVAHFQEGRDIPEYKLINGSIRVDWPSGGDRPFEEPVCGFANGLCKKDDRHAAAVVAAGIIGLVLFCICVIIMSVYRKWKIELEIEGLLWKISVSEIKGYSSKDIVSSPSKVSLMSAQSFNSRGSNQVFTSTARLRGAVVRIKELKFSRKKDISREIKKDMRVLRELRHDNVNSFIGACIEPTRILLVTDYCAKGSLYDIIENEDIKLDDLFIASLVFDLIKGMIYIHNSSLVYHGNLKSSNCVVTSRWMLQVTDFGLHSLRCCAESESIGEHQHYRNQFWKAPEILRNGLVHGTQKGDVYAFAIIMYEIFSRKGPFGQTQYEPKEIIEMVKAEPVKGEAPFRPDIEGIVELCPDYVLNCITACWDENPDDRPNFTEIRGRLKKMRGGKTKNIMDQMMEMMEKYANNLEDIVSERTRLLCEEKRKTEDLLHRMLPQSVAEKLTMGLGVEPVSYDLVTIYFSDIVGFTAMSAESTPLQVVNFLNDLYTVFDRVIRGYDVYKVETIGDAYMVVSGLPIKNDDRHAGEIASMALELLQAVKQHRIAHRPNETLKLRIGIHTGPVVAGVVGLTMPRYCLFGDTVNTASRMESNGEALKIHISSKCKDALDKLDGYITEKRGVVYMKGKGEVITYWLVGANDQAIQKKPVDMTNLPPPLFCRPRRSPKLNSELYQTNSTSVYNRGGGSRRQSSVPRTDAESSYSLQSSIYQIQQRDSPYMEAKRYNAVSATNRDGDLQNNGISERLSCYSNIGMIVDIADSDSVADVSHSLNNTSEHSDLNCDKSDIGTADTGGGMYRDIASSATQHKPFARVRPHRRPNMKNLTRKMYSSGIVCGSAINTSQQNLREAHSLDLISPASVPKRIIKNSPVMDAAASAISIISSKTQNDRNVIQQQMADVPFPEVDVIRMSDTLSANELEELDDNDDDENINLLTISTQHNNRTQNRNSPRIVPVCFSLTQRDGSGESGCVNVVSQPFVVPYKHLNNNCNGGIGIEDNVRAPLLLRRPPSFTSRSASIKRGKRWHSLETIEHKVSNVSVAYATDIGETSSDITKGMRKLNDAAHHMAGSRNSSSFLDRLVSLFHGNGKRASEASLKNVGGRAGNVGSIPAFSELGSATKRDRESIV